MKLSTTDLSQTAQLAFYDGSSGGGALISTNSMDLKISTDSGTTSHVTVKSSGNVGIGTTSPSSKFKVNGAIATAVVSKAFADSPYTATDADSVILVDSSGGAVTINLPAASGCPGRMYTVKKIDASVNTVTLDGNGAETIDGGATLGLNSQNDFVTIISNGSAWYVISKEITPLSG